MTRSRKRISTDDGEQPEESARKRGNVRHEIDEHNVQVPLVENLNVENIETAGSRREDMAVIARRRAAHFAHFQADDEEGKEDAHTGGTEARKLGPWSSAMELVEARGAAAEARQDRISEATKAKLKAENVTWTPKRDLKLGRRPEPAVDTLYNACIACLVDNIADVESLWGMPEVIMIRLAEEVCKLRKLSVEVGKLFTEGGPMELILPDCTQFTSEDLITVLTPALTSRLERLELNLCGRAVGAEIAAAVAMSAGTSGLNIAYLALGGAYRLTTADLLCLLKGLPRLQELHLPQCCRIEGEALQQLPVLAPNLRVLDLTDCRGLDLESLKSVLYGQTALSSLEALHLDGISEVNDMLLAEISISLPQLSRLSISFCSQVTDVGLRGVAAGRGPKLTDLLTNETPLITDDGLMALSEACPNLKVLSLQRCHKVTDVGLASIASRGMLRSLGASKVHSLGAMTIKALSTYCSEKLEDLDISWCRGVSSNALGLLVDACSNLRQLTIFGCSQIGPDFLYGHSNDQLVILGATEQRCGPPEMVKLKLADTKEHV